MPVRRQGMSENLSYRPHELHSRTGDGFVPPVLVGERGHAVFDHLYADADLA